MSIFCLELNYYRERQHRVEQRLVVLIDADKKTLEERVRELDQACSAAGLRPREDNERVAIFVPARNIESWLAYLAGQPFNETDTYAKLDRPRDCQAHVEQLHAMCRQGKLRQPAPSSLQAACVEYQSRLVP